jgi:hypothetical protein
MTSLLGLSTYAYFWRMSDRVPTPMSLDDVLRDAASHDGVDLVQVCDHLPLDTASDERLAELKALADDLGLVLEVGTRGTAPEHLARYLHVAEHLGATLVRSTTGPTRRRPNGDSARPCPRTRLPASRSPSRRTRSFPPRTSSPSSPGSGPTTSGSASTRRTPSRPSSTRRTSSG